MNAPAKQTDLAALRQPLPNEARMPAVSVGFGNLQSFELTQRVAKLFASSTLVPTQYRQWVKSYNSAARKQEWEENPAAMSNCAIALSIADRMHADPLMVMQNLHIIEGRPSWSSVWIIASINQCGRFEPLRYDMTPKGDPRPVEYEYHEWQGRGDNREKVMKRGKVTIRDRSCIAWTVPKGTVFPAGVNTRKKAIEAGLSVFESTEISMQLAIDEGWLTRNGSKWQTMSDQMLVYRSAAFFGRVYAPELLLGLPSDDELQDILEAQRSSSGQWSVPDMGEIRPPANGIDPGEPGQDGGETGDPGDTDAGATIIDQQTGEITQQAGTADPKSDNGQPDPMTRQAFEDACKLVQAGQYDEARAICPADQKKTLEGMIANREGEPGTAKAATTRTARRAASRPVGNVD